MNVCPQCQAERASLDQVCPNCGYQFVDPEARRPGFVTAYAIISCILAAIVGIYGIASSAGSAYGVPRINMLEIALYIGPVIVYGVIGIGLWRLQNWARVLTIALNTLALLSTCSRLSSTIQSSMDALFSRGGYDDPLGPVLMMLVPLVSLFVRGSVAYWFFDHRELFEGKVT